MSSDIGKSPQGAPLLDRSDVRVRHDTGVGGAIRGFLDRVRSGDLGSLPVVVGLVIIWSVFQGLNPVFLSSNNLVNLLFDCSTVGVIALGIVCILMVGEIDLSVGSVSGFASAMVGVLWVNSHWPRRTRDRRRAGGRCRHRLPLRAAVQPARHAELRIDALGPARGAGAAALHPRLQRIDQPALRLNTGEPRPDARDAPHRGLRHRGTGGDRPLS